MNSELLAGQVALVTGASRGIGQAIAKSLAARGAKVIGTATSEAGAASITAYFEASGLSGRGVCLNVTDAAACEALIDSIARQRARCRSSSIMQALRAITSQCA